ncbi:MAG: hypothetical protein B6226_02735 [Candidatus Cloacimonetes bacterium 4572_65]|nr:MAG: hypothetical protein B6226_02735 [Candidatus Cloacimonetes bacterium 4572_65]
MKILTSDDLIIQKLPEVRATYYFTDGESVLFAGMTSNLFARITRLSEMREDDEKIKELWEKSLDLTYDIRLKDIDSLVWYKSLLKNYTPYYNDYINIWENYVYLGISYEEVPFIAVKDNTQTDHLYLGPFRSRFFLQDILSIFSKYLKLPNCSDKQFPCELLEDKSCLGYCLDIKPDELRELFGSTFLSYKNSLPEILNKAFQEYSDNLEFIKAEEVRIETKLILKYYKYLNFLTKTKSLNKIVKSDGIRYNIEKGLIASVAGEDCFDYSEQNRDIPYRDNELYALNKNQLDERWIVFEFLESLKNNVDN